MKYTSILLAVCALCSLAACNPAKQATTAPQYQKGVAMEFDKTHVDLGKIKKGETRDMFYVLTNTGTDTLAIDIISACHCTTLDYPTAPIPSGGKARINAVFDSKEKEKSEVITIDIIFKNTNPENGYPLVKQLTYSYELET
jgi:hypothetical protein